MNLRRSVSEIVGKRRKKSGQIPRIMARVTRVSHLSRGGIGAMPPPTDDSSVKRKVKN